MGLFYYKGNLKRKESDMAFEPVSPEGTDLEKQQQEDKVQEGVYDEAFDIAEKGEDHTDLHADDNPDNHKDEPPVEEKPKPSASDDKPPTDNKSIKDDDATYEQRWKSQQGIIKSMNQRFETEKNALSKELANLKTTIAELSDKKNKKEDTADNIQTALDSLSEEDKKALQEYEKEFDVVSKMEGLKRKQELDKLKKELVDILEGKTKELSSQFNSKLTPIATNQQEAEKIRHFGYLSSQHPDYEKYRDDGSILNWIEAKPKYIQDALKKTYNEGSAEDVVDLISDFKKENNLLENANNDSANQENLIDLERKKAEKADKKQALTAVSTKRNAVNIAHAPADDYDSAFDEAVKR
jgi:hypothetical protein